MAASEGIVAIDFLDTLAWLVHCGKVTVERADDIERKARAADGWRPNSTYSGTIADERAIRIERIAAAFRARQ